MRTFLAASALALFAMRAGAAVPQTERDALIALYESTSGQGWVDHTNWLGAPGSECTWFGVRCDESDAHVVEVSLYTNNLVGTLPPDLRKLTALRQLEVWQNSLHGTLPSELSELSQLAILYVQDNQLTGTIPASYGALQKLEQLGLDGNQLTGPLPAQLGDMFALRELTASYNDLHGSIPKELGKLTNLELLGLGVNALSGSIPRELGACTKLKILDLQNNALTGGIPSELGDLAALEYLNFSYNQLSGGIPPSLGKLAAVQELYLGANPLGGTIPKELGSLPAVKRLDLTALKLTGSVPDELFEATTLQSLKLSDNELSGPIPASLAKLTDLELLSIYSNHFSGPVPPALTTLSKLQVIEAESNELTGAIPPELAQLTNLTSLDLAENELTGGIPVSLATLAHLEYLSLYENQLTGGIPPQLGALTNLTVLFLGGNPLGGTIPDDLRHLTKMEQFTAYGCGLTGTIPFWIGEWPQLTDLRISENELTGALPPGFVQLDLLEYLDVGNNQLGGPLPDFAHLTHLRYLTIDNNSFSGPLSPSFGLLTALIDARMERNEITGPLPHEIGNLSSIVYLNLSQNHLDGTLPPELGQLSTLQYLVLGGNRFTNTIPREIGNLPNLGFLDLSFNALRGPIPKEITKLTGLADGQAQLQYNALFTSDASVREFVNAKQSGGDFEETQTVAPTNVHVATATDRNATLTWTPIPYDFDEGGYQVAVRKSSGGAPVAYVTTSSKYAESVIVRNLDPATQYFFTVATVSHPHDFQQNLIVSDASPGVATTTLPHTPAPADVDVTELPSGLVQIDGVEVISDGFALTNFGDVATSLTIDRGDDFFTVTPSELVLAAGETKTIALHAVSKPAGSYYSGVVVHGAGTGNGLLLDIVMLSTARPSGSVVAQPVTSRVEIAGAANGDGVGVAQFRNAGTAPLTGVVVSDQPWVEPSHDAITIEPGSIATINFQVRRSRRAAGEGTFVANLRLVYVNGTTFSGDVRRLLDTGTSGVSVSTVTVVDTTQPNVTTGSIPSLGTGELALFVAGLRSSGGARTDLALVNAAGAPGISDLRLYFTHGLTTNIAALAPLDAAKTLSLENLTASIYGTTDSGTLQIRTTGWEGLSAGAKVTNVTTGGTNAGTIPVFRGDRGVSSGQSMYLTGLASPGDLVLQNLSGASTVAHIVYLDAAGQTIATRDETLDPWAMVERDETLPANTATAILTSNSGAITAYARLRDASGDAWSVVDWSAFYGYPRTAAVRVPYADGGSESGRRRVARHDTAPHFATQLALFNPGTAAARARIDVIDAAGTTASHEVTIAPKATLLQSNAGSSSHTATANVIVTPLEGEVVATARSRSANGGTAIPVVSATSGLRLGQTTTFSALDDTAAQQTSYGFVETSNAAVTVRARIFISGSNALVTAVTERDFTLGARQQVLVPELLRSFAGPDRDSLGDLHNLVLEIEIVDGAGSVVPFIIGTDAGTGDLSLSLR